jgi:hypothetical protein
LKKCINKIEWLSKTQKLVEGAGQQVIMLQPFKGLLNSVHWQVNIGVNT